MNRRGFHWRPPKKKERWTQGRSLNPDQGALKNSTWTSAPFQGRGYKALLLQFKSRKAQVGRFQ